MIELVVSAANPIEMEAPARLIVQRVARWPMRSDRKPKTRDDRKDPKDGSEAKRTI
jgi:hypothetical protein